MRRSSCSCPICGALNRGLDLEETGGWMECEKCGTLSMIEGRGKQTFVLFPLKEGKITYQKHSHAGHRILIQ